MLQVGVDCEEISRFRRLPYNKNERFYRRIFTEREITYCRSYRDPYPRFAARFAAKEAAIKALNGVAKSFYTDIEIRKGKGEEPRLYLNKKKFKTTKNLDMSLSLTHSGAYAIAFVVITDDKSNRREIQNFLRKNRPRMKKIR